jgi:hypothetical protein
MERQGILSLLRHGDDITRFSIASGSRSLSAEFAWYRAVESDDHSFRIEKIVTASEAEPADLRPMLDIQTETISRRISLRLRSSRPAPTLGDEWEVCT